MRNVFKSCVYYHVNNGLHCKLFKFKRWDELESTNRYGRQEVIVDGNIIWDHVTGNVTIDGGLIEAIWLEKGFDVDRGCRKTWDVGTLVVEKVGKWHGYGKVKTVLARSGWARKHEHVDNYSYCWVPGQNQSLTVEVIG